VVNVSRSGCSYRWPVTSPAACPSCGAAVRPDSPWCTLCYADLRPKAPEPEPAPAPEPAPIAAPTVAKPPRGLPGDEPTWPCTTCGAVNAMERSTCASCGAGFMAAAKDDAPLLELPVVGDITRLGRGQRFALAGGVVLAFILLTLLVGVVLG
jgi:hypothetical protein